MRFNWNNNMDGDLDSYTINLKENEENIILAIEMRTFPVEGCCGLIRYNTIFPVGYIASFDSFKEEAIKTIEKYEKDRDIYLLEYFEAVSGQESRGTGKSRYKLELIEGKWSYYERGEEREIQELY